MKGPRDVSHSYAVYMKYFRSKFVIFMLAVVLFHVGILLSDIIYLQYTRGVLNQGELPENNPNLKKMMDSTDNNIYRQQARLANKGSIRRAAGILSKSIDFLVIFSFFSHTLREQIMKRIKGYKSLIRINCSHIKEIDVNFMVLAFLVLGIKSTLFEWIFIKKQDVLDLAINLVVQVFRCIVIAPLLIWMFSSVYNKTSWGLVLSAYIATAALILIANCSDLIPETNKDLEVVPLSAFDKGLQSEIKRLKLTGKILWDSTDQPENAALVKTGSSRYIIILGNLLKYGREEFVSFIAHEIGHADDHSTEKKLLATVFGLGISCGLILSLVHFISPKYESKGISKFSVLVFVILSNVYIISSLVNMFHNNLGILAEMNADIYAKNLGYAPGLAFGLYKLSVENRSSLFHSQIFTHYVHDHPTISSRVRYLNK
ncbi:STE24 endopeptidase [Nematocida sp. AWRm80]|nr:STE24 endopeptidase [Nematocida sp. AWRm80]